MESVQFYSVTSRHFSPAGSPASPSQFAAIRSRRNASESKFKSKAHVSSCCSPWTGSAVASSLSSKGSFATELWRVVNAKTVSTRREMRSVIRSEMFGQLTSGFEAAWSKLKGQEVLTKENIAEPMRDIRRALLEADVSLPVVRRFVESVSDQAVGTELIKGVRPDQQLVKIVRDELVKLIGGEVS